MGAIPPEFPRRAVMILGHNFDSAARLGTFCKSEDCFFTNIYVGLQPLVSRGELKVSDSFKEQCRNFLKYQVERTKPSLIAVLGIPAREEFSFSYCKTDHVELNHPSYAAQCGATPKRDLVVARAAGKLSAALDTCCGHLDRHL
jgi:hypothetical protein